MKNYLKNMKKDKAKEKSIKHNWYIYPSQIVKVARVAKEKGISQSKLIRDLIEKI